MCKLNWFGHSQDSKKKIEVLPPLNHAEIDYPDFEKNFYDEAPEVAALTPAQARYPPPQIYRVFSCSFHFRHP